MHPPEVKKIIGLASEPFFRIHVFKNNLNDP